MRKWLNKQTIIMLIVTSLIFSSITSFAAYKIKSATYGNYTVKLDGNTLNTKIVDILEEGQKVPKQFINVMDISKYLGVNVAVKGKNITFTKPVPPKPLTLEEIVYKCIDSVVMIRVYDTDNMDTAKLCSLGSGVVIGIGNERYILTNKHVVSGGKMYGIQYNDMEVNRELRTTEVKTLDTELDISLIKAPRQYTFPIPFGDSNSVKIGDRIVTIASPHGAKNTIVEGTVSALRNETGFTGIQVNAKDGPGASGGAVINSKGELISLIYGGPNDYEDISYTIPINKIKEILKKEL